MLRLRPYKKCDAESIVKWLKDEETFWKWSAGKYDHYPITADDINQQYEEKAFSDSFYVMTAFDETGAAGHLSMRFLDEEKRVLRFGSIIVDDAKRGRGYGKKMLELSLRYAFDILKAEKVTIVVFRNNQPAYLCYKSLGFHEVIREKTEYFHVFDEDWEFVELEMDKGTA